jgi:hypothetical protein
MSEDPKTKLAEYKHLVAFAVTGLIATPVIPLGEGPDMYLAPIGFLGERFSKALYQSFESFGIRLDRDVTVVHPKVLIVPMRETSESSIRNVLLISDMALAFFNKKCAFARARFVEWDRRAGSAVGAYIEDGEWKPILRPRRMAGPGILRPLPKDFWDWFLGRYLRDSLPELGVRLLKCLEWERESDFSPHVTHRFAFLWIGLESMLPKGECDQGSLVRRYSLVAFSPRGADSQIIRGDPVMRSFFELHPNPHSREWAQVIQEMYEYRCAILHDGSTDLNSAAINPNKVDWFYHIAKRLVSRVEGLAINALIDNVTDVGLFWSSFVMGYLYSDRNHWLSNGTLLEERLITFDWERSRFPEVM